MKLFKKVLTKMRALFRRLARRVEGWYITLRYKDKNIQHWQQRAKALGELSVYNLNHKDSDLGEVTQRQMDAIRPHLLNCLNGRESKALDFGCGSGRFTPFLAESIHGRASGIDPIKRLIRAAPKSDQVEYRVMQANAIPYPAACFDVVWVCLVLGGITDRDSLRKTAAEIDRVLKPRGLLFLVENTSHEANHEYWQYFHPDQLVELFPNFPLRKIGEYFDLDEEISILAARKPYC